MNSPVCICSADRVCGSAATMTPVRIVPMSCAGDLVSFVSRRAECLAAAGLVPVTHRALASAVSGAVRVPAVHGKRKLSGRIRPSRFVSTRPTSLMAQ